VQKNRGKGAFRSPEMRSLARPLQNRILAVREGKGEGRKKNHEERVSSAETRGIWEKEKRFSSPTPSKRTGASLLPPGKKRETTGHRERERKGIMYLFEKKLAVLRSGGERAEGPAKTACHKILRRGKNRLEGGLT